ncbi:MAG: hybrid sensor histidine kinase/response regulator [Massilia sp.]|nr:hybrid sensor histidine kinase/response regulator [Massilia sp.]
MPSLPSADFEHLPADGEMVTLLRGADWAASSLGPPSSWPESLRIILNVCFDSHFPIAVWWGPELIQFYNDGYRPILGATKHPAAFGRPARETWPDIWPTISPMVDQVVNQGIAVKGDDMPLVLNRNGYPELCNFTFSYSPIRDGAGKVVGMFTAAVETTARVLAERRQAFQLTLVDGLRGAADVDQLVQVATDLTRAHLGVERAFYAEIDADSGGFHIPQRWISGPALSIPEQGRADDFGPHLMGALKRGKNVVVEEMADHPELAGYAEVYAALGIDAIVVIPLIRGGRLRANFNVAHPRQRRWSAGDIAIIADAAERTWDAVARARAEQALRAANERKDEFLAMLAHELRNPLAPISAAAELLSMRDLDAARIAKTSAVIRRQVTHMTGLVDDLLDMSRVTRGLITLRRQPVDLREVVTAAVEQVRPLLQARRQELLVDAPAAPVTVLGDLTRLVQVVSNLLNNAAKFTAPGGRIGIVVGSTVVSDGAQAALTVSDDGIGMESELVARAFELFAQGQRNADRSQGGLGIGLALVKNLVELHGGKVAACSAGVNLGSSFTITLPFAPADAA